MSRSIWLERNGKTQVFSRNEVQRYFDYVEEKERQRYDHDPVIPSKREAVLRTMEEEEVRQIGIHEVWSSALSDVLDVPMSMAIPRDTDQQLRELVDGLRDAKETLEEEGPDDVNWETTLELGPIALAEFAREQDLGVILG